MAVNDRAGCVPLQTVALPPVPAPELAAPHPAPPAIAHYAKPGSIVPLATLVDGVDGAAAAHQCLLGFNMSKATCTAMLILLVAIFARLFLFD